MEFNWSRLVGPNSGDNQTIEQNVIEQFYADSSLYWTLLSVGNLRYFRTENISWYDMAKEIPMMF